MKERSSRGAAHLILNESPDQEWEDEDEDEQDEDQEGESAAETSLSEALEGVAVRDDNDEAASGHRRLTKAQKALVRAQELAILAFVFS